MSNLAASDIIWKFVYSTTEKKNECYFDEDQVLKFIFIKLKGMAKK